MNKQKANVIIQKYESKEKHTMGEKLQYVKAKAFLRNEALKIN